MMTEQVFLLEQAEKTVSGCEEISPARRFAFLPAATDRIADLFVAVYTTLKTLYTVAKPGKKSVFYD